MESQRNYSTGYLLGSIIGCICCYTGIMLNLRIFAPVAILFITILVLVDVDRVRTRGALLACTISTVLSCVVWLGNFETVDAMALMGVGTLPGLTSKALEAADPNQPSDG